MTIAGTKIIFAGCGLLLLLTCLLPRPVIGEEDHTWLLPVGSDDRRDWASVRITRIGMFALERRPRPGIPAHLHTGIDIKRPKANHTDEPIFAASGGKVISLRDDGPFAQLIIAHRMADGGSVWTVYEHIAGIRVAVGEVISPAAPIARFMNKQELDRFGWQFDHVHFEVLKHRPRALMPSADTPYRFFATYSLACHTLHDLQRYYHDPIEFLEKQWQSAASRRPGGSF
jgi:murein DD-endopeptidase MepM/ murein hydrolase activator NlpD